MDACTVDMKDSDAGKGGRFVRVAAPAPTAPVQVGTDPAGKVDGGSVPAAPLPPSLCGASTLRRSFFGSGAEAAASSL